MDKGEWYFEVGYVELLYAPWSLVSLLPYITSAILNRL